MIIFLSIFLFITPTWASFDESKCYEAETGKFNSAIEAEGFYRTGSRQFSVKTHSFGSNNYWKESIAYRYEKDQQVVYSTCYGLKRSPIPIQNDFLIEENYWHWRCTEQPCFYPRDYSWNKAMRGKVEIFSIDFLLDGFGVPMLSLNIKTTVPYKNSKRINEPILFKLNGESWRSVSNSPAEFEFKSQNISSGFIEVPNLDGHFNQYDRDRFQYKLPQED